MDFSDSGLYKPDGSRVYIWKQMKKKDIINVSNGTVSGKAKDSLQGVLVIDEEVKTIAASGFSGCTGLTEVTIPGSVKTISAAAFKDSSSLAKVTYNGKSFTNKPQLNKAIEANGGTVAADAWDGTALSDSGPVKYAVAIYGIGQDVDQNGNTKGITFGPALGANYVNSYKSHTPSGNTASGNAHRCLHDDDWNTIISWNHTDSNVYEQCISEGCTHRVELDLSRTSTLENKNFKATYTGDGPSVLNFELYNGTNENLRWNPADGTYGTDKDGWGATRIRAMLNGADSLTNLNDSQQSDDINKSASVYTSTNCLFNAFPDELKAAIGAKEVRYDSVYNSQTEANLKTTYDKLWLFSPNELGDFVSSSDHNHPLEGTVYTKMAGTGDVRNNNSTRVGYSVNSKSGGFSSTSDRWWLRSSNSDSSYSALCITIPGYVSNYGAYYDLGVAPGFTLSR